MTIHVHPAITREQLRWLESKTAHVCTAYGELVPRCSITRISTFRQALEKMPFVENFSNGDKPTPPAA